MIRGLITLFFAYILAAPLTEKISMDLTQTEWANIWTYVIWLFSFAIWSAVFFVVVIVLAALAGRN